MTMQRFFMGSAEPLGDDEVGVVAITAGIKRDGNEWIPSGVQLADYRANPIVLMSHDVMEPVATTTAIGLTGGEIAARIRFAPVGVSAIADKVRGLVKSGVLSGISAGVDPIEVEPIDQYDRRCGLRITRSNLLELSFCAVPIDTNARVVQRSYDSHARRMTLLRRLPPVSRGSIDRVEARIAPSTTSREERYAALIARAKSGQLPPYTDTDPYTYQFLLRVYFEAGRR